MSYSYRRKLTERSRQPNATTNANRYGVDERLGSAFARGSASARGGRPRGRTSEDRARPRMALRRA